MNTKPLVQIRHIKANTILGYVAVYFVVFPDGTKQFGTDYKAAHAAIAKAEGAKP